MILRYKVEGNHTATFTARKKVKDKGGALMVCRALSLLNGKEGYKKYSDPILYSDENKIIERLTLKP